MLRHVSSNFAFLILKALVFFAVLTPFVVRTLGPDLNGVWVTVVSMAGFLSLLAMGVPMASVRFLSRELGRDDKRRANEVISTCLGIYVVLGLVALGVGGLLYLFFEQKYIGGEVWQQYDPDYLVQGRLAFRIILLHVGLGFVLRLPYGVFEAHQEFGTKNAIEATQLLLRVVLIVGLLSLNVSIVYMACIEVFCALFVFTTSIVILKRRHPELSFSLKGFDRGLVRSVLSFSVFAFLLNVGTMLAFRCDAMVIGAYLGPDSVTDYDNGNKFSEQLIEIVLAIGMVVMPLASRLQASGQNLELRDVFLKWSKVCLSVVLMVILYLMVLGPDFLGMWLGERYAGPSGRVLRILMASFLLFLPIRGVALPILMGLGRPGRPALALLLMGLLNVVISLSLVGPYGISGVAVGTAIPNLLFAGTVLWLTCRELDVSLPEYFGYVGGRALVGSVPALAWLWFCKDVLDVSGAVPLVLSGVAMVGIYGATWVLFVYRGDRYLDLYGKVRARLARSRA